MGRALVLASGSPQRRQILGDLGLDFTVCPTDVAEERVGTPGAVAVGNALRKARAGAALGSGDRAAEVVIGCDTLVATGARLWGKPADAAAAAETLRHLAGATHEVVSGLAVAVDGTVTTATEVTLVTLRALDEATIAWYVGTGEWEGRAGGYAIQGRGATLVARIEGDYLNVVGLPVGALLGLCPGLVAEFRAPAG